MRNVDALTTRFIYLFIYLLEHKSFQTYIRAVQITEYDMYFTTYRLCSLVLTTLASVRLRRCVTLRGLEVQIAYAAPSKV